MSEFQPILSAEGERRRQRILGLAIKAAQGRRRRRVTVRVVVAGLLVATLLPASFRVRNVPHQPIAIRPQETHTPPQTPATAIVSRIETDPHIIERLAIPPQPLHVTVITDRELLDDLAKANRPAALAYVNGKAMLLYR